MRVGVITSFLALLGVGVCGCASTVPKGMTEQDAKDAINRMTPEQKIRAISSSPMPQTEKEKRYAEIESETGVKASDVHGNQPTIPGGN